MAAPTPTDRRRLRAALREVAPWLDRTDVGPRAVAASDCPRCGRSPAILPTCGPVAWQALCPSCAHDVGDDGWCDGHAQDGHEARAWASALPEDWAGITHLWWVATGEVRPDEQWLDLVRRVVPALQEAEHRGRPAGGR